MWSTNVQNLNGCPKNGLNLVQFSNPIWKLVQFSDVLRSILNVNWTFESRPFKNWPQKSLFFSEETFFWIMSSTVGIWSISPEFKWLGFSDSYSYSPDHLKTGPFKIRTLLSWFQMVFDKIAVICLDFKWLGFQISDPIQKPDHLKPNLFSTIWNPD